MKIFQKKKTILVEILLEELRSISELGERQSVDRNTDSETRRR